MTRRLRRLAAVGVLATATMTGLGGCIQRTSASSAALVGSDAITNDQLLTNVAQGKVGTNANQTDPLTFERQRLTTMVNDELLQRVADAHHVTVSQGDIDSYVAVVGGRNAVSQQLSSAGYAPGDVDAELRRELLQQKVGLALTSNLVVPQQELQAAYNQFIASFDRAQVELVAVRDAATAQRLISELGGDPSRFASVAAHYGSVTQLGTVGHGQGSDPTLDKAIFSHPSGSVFAVPDGKAVAVVHVIKRTTYPLSQVEPLLRFALLRNQILPVLQRALMREAEQVKVTVNPRYGQYATAKLAVVPRGFTGSVPAPGSATTATPSPLPLQPR